MNIPTTITRRLLTCLLLALFAAPPIMADDDDVVESPSIIYSSMPKRYEIGGITVSGIDNYEDYVLIGLSGLSVGQVIDVPGDEITEATKRYWKNGLFSNVKITAEKIVGNKIYLNIELAPRPRLTEINYNGVKKSEREDLEEKIGLMKGNQINPNMINKAKILIRRYYDEKGFKNATIDLVQRDDITTPGQVILDINVDKKEKIKVHSITIEGNESLTDNKLKWAMKKTNERGFNRYLFRQKKFTENDYEADKDNLINKYNEFGYRDAHIISDSVIPYDDKTVDIILKVEEGNQYHLRNINWVGNTVYPSEALNEFLQMKGGDVYNQKLLNERLTEKDDAVGNLYYNNGYVFFQCQPIETNVTADSLDLEMRILEGPQATINHVRIAGNDRLYENVVRRQLLTLPGALFNKDAIMRSMREIAAMGHFNPEAINPDIQPDVASGTVDINWMLESKANDQVEFSIGYGQTGVIGKVALKFTNFSMYNLFHKSDNYRAFIPQGDGQTFSISGQTNGRYYYSGNISFVDPWLGGKRPNQFSFNAFYAKQTGVNQNYYSSAMNNYMYNSMYGGYYGGYGGYNDYYYNNYEAYYDLDKYMKMYGVSIGWGKRLHWPDDYFTLYGELGYQRYDLNNWDYYFIIRNGRCNNINAGITLSRNSVDNPIYPRRGSEFTFSVSATPPYSLWDGVDYQALSSVRPTDANYTQALKDKYRWIEFHKWKLKGKFYTALTGGQKCFVLMTRAEFGILGHYNPFKKSPFETFYVGGDGMSGYSYNYYTDMIALRGYDNGAVSQGGYAYTRFTTELRYPLMFENSTQIYALAFLEGGNAWDDVKRINFFDMKRSAGVGVRINLPMVGLMGVDWAYGFDPINGSTNSSGSQFHFILGQEF